MVRSTPITIFFVFFTIKQHNFLTYRRPSANCPPPVTSNPNGLGLFTSTTFRKSACYPTIHHTYAVRRLEKILCKNLANSSQPTNQPTHLSPQTQFYLHYPRSSSTHNPAFLPRSTCPRFSQPLFFPDKLHKEPIPLVLFNSKTMFTHFKLYILPITLCTKEFIQTLPQSTKPPYEPIKSTEPSYSILEYWFF